MGRDLGAIIQECSKPRAVLSQGHTVEGDRFFRFKCFNSLDRGESHHSPVWKFDTNHLLMWRQSGVHSSGRKDRPSIVSAPKRIEAVGTSETAILGQNRGVWIGPASIPPRLKPRP